MTTSIPLKLTRLQDLPSAWQKWHSKISDLLELDHTRPLCDQPLPQPWFLFPVQSELSGREADDLFTALRSYLQPSAQTPVAAIRRRLQSLSPDASLPFLYGMRYIAFASGGNHFYWPPFRRILFENRLSYDEVAVSLAGTTADLWMRLFAYTRRSLYHPLEGPVNIKWPLAHAGLLPEHKKTLEELGTDLLLEGEEAFHETLTLDTDEFILRFRDWLRSSPRHAYAPFSLLIQSRRPERQILAELGQRWLHQEGPRLKTQANIAQSVQPSPLLPRRRLHYHAATNQIGIIFSLGRLKIGREAHLAWNGQTWQLRFRDLNQQGVRLFDELFLPLYSPDWPAEATVTIAPDDSVTIAMPTLDRDSRRRQGLVFDSVSGDRAKRWQPGEHYVILVVGKLLDRLEPGRLFSEWFDLGTPEGRWPEYRLLQVRTHDTETWDDLSSQELQAMEQAAEFLGLPSFEHHFRARIRLIGGDLLAHSSHTGPIFSAAAALYAEVTGHLTTPIDIVLQRRHNQTGEFGQIDQLRLLSPDQGHSQIIELPSHALTAGHYRLNAGDECVDFTLVDEQDPLVGSQPAALHIEVSLINTAGQTVAVPNRHALEEDGSHFDLLIKAWPAADLQLQIATAVGIKPFVFPILTDGQGVWRERFARLPIAWDALPPGDLSLTIGWRGLFTQTIVAEDKTYCSLTAFDFTVRASPGGMRFVFGCQGRLKGAPQATPLYGYLLPPQPWQHSPRMCGLHIDAGGYFKASIILDWQPGWFVLGDHRLLDKGDALIIAVRELQDTGASKRSVVLDLSQALTPHITAWYTLANRIRNIDHPARLSIYVLLAALLHCLQAAHDFLMAQPAWTSINRWDEWPRLVPLVQQARWVAVFRKRLPAGHAAQPVLGVAVQFPPHPAEVEQLAFRFTNTNLPVGGQLRKVNYYGVERIVIVPEATLCACGKCNVILPAAAFDDHMRPYAEMPSCTALQPQFTQYLAGASEASEYVAVGVLSDLGEQLRHMRAYLAESLRLRQVPSDAYRPLMERLKTLRPDAQNPAGWLAGLIDALDALENLRQRYQQDPRFSLADLENLGTPLAGYEPALTAIIGALGQNRTDEPVAVPPSEAKTLPAAVSISPTSPTPAPASRDPTRPPLEAPQSLSAAAKQPLPATDQATPTDQPTPHHMPTAQAGEQVQMTLESYDARALDYTVGALVRQLASVQIKVRGPIPLPVRHDEGIRRHKRILFVPADSKWADALRSLRLPRGVEIILSSRQRP